MLPNPSAEISFGFKGFGFAVGGLGLGFDLGFGVLSLERVWGGATSAFRVLVGFSSLLIVSGLGCFSRFGALRLGV